MFKDMKNKDGLENLSALLIRICVLELILAIELMDSGQNEQSDDKAE